MSRPPHLLDALRDTVLLCDGGMGSRVQGMTLDVDRDFHGKENCTDVLNLSRPDLVRDIHRGYFEAGADMVETNTFGGSPVTLAEFDIAERAFEINKRGGELAREAAEQFSDGRHRWVIGSVGPGTKLPSLGNIAYDPLEAALALQCRGLIAGGVDAILIETCQDTLQIKAAVNGAKIARAEAGSDIPIFVQVTVETTGTLLVGPDIAAAAAVVHALDVPLMGLNCAHRPAGDGRACPLAGGELAGPAVDAAECRPAGTGRWPDALSARRRPIWPAGWSASSSEDGVNLIGGCCGTNTQHIAALDAMLRRRAQAAGIPARRRWRASRCGCRRSPACTRRCRCGRRTRSSPSASAATPTARRSGARRRRSTTGTAASRWAASRSAKAPTRSMSARRSSAATRSAR